jgi:uncharacterized membrane protein YkvA (DUF1232 family)
MRDAMSYEQAAGADSTQTDSVHETGEARRVRVAFWPKLRRIAASLPFVEELLAAYYCAFDRDTPRHVQAALIGALGYFILPFDLAPDMSPLLGFSDDATALAAVVRLVAAHITPAHREAAKRAIARGLNDGR